MSNVDENQVKKPLSKLEYWSLISGIVVLGILWFLTGLYGRDGVVILFGIIIFSAVFISVRSWHQKRCRDYEDYLREQEDYLREQAHLYEGIRSIVNTANRRLQEIYQNQEAARKALGRAENHFNHTAYSPFWDEIETAASELGRFSENLAELSSGLEDYLRVVPRYHGVAPRFPGASKALVKIRKLGNALAKRMSTLVYKAQRNFKFSNIYEHRQTRKILVAGFKNFADILKGVGNQISTHIEELTTTVQVYNEEMAALMEDASKQHQERQDETWIQRELHHVELMQSDLEKIELGRKSIGKT